MSEQTGNGSGGDADATERREKMREAVRDLPDPERRKLTQEDIDTLRRANLGEIADIGARYLRPVAD